MENYTINEMQEMQRALQDKYKDIWETISPEIGQNKLLWMIGGNRRSYRYHQETRWRICMSGCESASQPR